MDEDKGTPSSDEGNPADEEGAISKSFYDPVEHIEPKQMKYVMMLVTTTMSEAEVGRALGVSDYLRRKWDKNEHIEEYKKQVMKRYDSEEIVEAARRQTLFIRSKMFDEVASRFEDPEEACREYFTDENGNPREPSVQEKMAFLDRFAKFASFDKLMKTWKDVEKSFRLDAGQATERKDDTAIEHQIRARFTNFKNREAVRKNLDKSAEEAAEKGLTWEEFQALNNEESEDSQEDEVVDAEIVEPEEEYEVTIEEWEIKRG